MIFSTFEQPILDMAILSLYKHTVIASGGYPEELLFTGKVIQDLDLSLNRTDCSKANIIPHTGLGLKVIKLCFLFCDLTRRV